MMSASEPPARGDGGHEPRAHDTAGLVLAAGQGERLGLGPKAFLKIGGQSLLRRTVGMLRGCVGRILVGVPTDQVASASAELGGEVQVYPGGAMRNATLTGLFQRCTEPLLVIHIAVRPFASATRLRCLIEAAREHGVACSYLPSSFDVMSVEDGFATTWLPRATAGLLQFPMVVQRPLLARMLQYSTESGNSHLTPFELARHLGISVRVMLGEETNIKITTPLDWQIATQVIAPDQDKPSSGKQG